MKMLEREGLAYNTAEYAGVYNRLLEEFSSEKTIQKMAGAMQPAVHLKLVESGL